MEDEVTGTKTPENVGKTNGNVDFDCAKERQCEL